MAGSLTKATGGAANFKFRRCCVFPNLRGISLRFVHAPILSRFGASEKNPGAVHFHADWVRITPIVSSCLFFVGKLLGDVNKYKINKRDILIWEIPLFSIGMVGREVGILPSNYAVTAVKLRSYCRQTTHPKKLIHKRFCRQTTHVLADPFEAGGEFFLSNAIDIMRALIGR